MFEHDDEFISTDRSGDPFLAPGDGSDPLRWGWTVARKDGLTLRMDGAFDFDGRVDGQFTVWLDAQGEGGAASVELSDLTLDLDLDAAKVPFAAGIGLEGGWRPCNGHEWRWEPSHPRTAQGYAPGMGEGATWDNMAWLGSPTAGVKLNLHPDAEVARRHNSLAWKLMRNSWPDSWYNSGRGRIVVEPARVGAGAGGGDAVRLRATTGARVLHRGAKPVVFRWNLMLTPVKPLDLR